MKSLLAASSIALILIAAPAAADYATCMKFCKEEYDFAHCHKICTEDMGKMPAANTGAIGAQERMNKNYGQLAGNTYKTTNNIVNSIEIVHFGHDGHTEYIVRSCFGEVFCEGTTEVTYGMVESNLECTNFALIYRGFKFEGINNFDNFNVTVYTSMNGKDPVLMEYIRIEDPSQVTESGCQ